MNEILTIAEMSKADAFAVTAGIPEWDLIENAGRASADAIAAHFAPCAVVVLCGPGNNGADGFVAARHLAERGFDVRVASNATTKGGSWQGDVAPLAPSVLDGAVLVVDALFGAGLSRPLTGAAAEVVAALNKSGVPVVALDIPSGVAGDSGRILGDVAVQAVMTVTFFRKKPAHLLLPGRDLCGEVILADIGISDDALKIIRPRIFENGPALWRDPFPWPRASAHKYARGHCVVVSGPMHATGAARLAARAALRVGAGLVTLASPPDALAVNAAHLTAIMLKPFHGARGLGEILKDTRINTVVMGPGMGVGGETRELVALALASTPRLVLDADALTSFRDDPDALFARLRPGVVLTPHDGEFERLFPGLLEENLGEDGAGKIEAARAAAARAGAVVLLKGSDTVIADPVGWAAINANAPPTLATAGAGDVLSGLIGGLLARNMDPALAAAAAAWLHGDAAARFGPGLIAEDLAEMLPESLTALADNA